jgi:hypothetical protein
MRSIIQKSLLHDNARPLTAAVTKGRKDIGRYCHTSLIVVTWHHAIFPVFRPLREALRSKRFQSDDEVTLFVQTAGREITNSFRKGQNEGPSAKTMVCKGPRIVYKNRYSFFKQFMIIKFLYKGSPVYI